MSARPLVFVLFAALLFVPAAAQARWFPSRDLDDPGDLVANEFARANLLNDAVQIGAGAPVYGGDESIPTTTSTPVGLAPLVSTDDRARGTFAARGRVGDAGAALGGSVLGHFTEHSTTIAGDLQASFASIRPRGLEVVTTRDWTFNLQLRAAHASIESPTAQQASADSWFVGLGVPFVSSSGENWSFRAFHDLWRRVHDADGTHWRWNVLGGMMYSSGDFISLSFDTGVIEEKGSWRVPGQATMWVNGYHCALGIGGGLAEVTEWHTLSLGLAAVVSLP
jgi:hypothetical protein